MLFLSPKYFSLPCLPRKILSYLSSHISFSVAFSLKDLNRIYHVILCTTTKLWAQLILVAYHMVFTLVNPPVDFRVVSLFVGPLSLSIMQSRCIISTLRLLSSCRSYIINWKHKRGNRVLTLGPGRTVNSRTEWNFFLNVGYGLITLISQFMASLSPYALAMRLRSPSHQEVESIFPLLESGLPLGLTLISRIKQKWWCKNSNPGLKTPCRILLIFPEHWPAVTWRSPS